MSNKIIISIVIVIIVVLAATALLMQREESPTPPADTALDTQPQPTPPSSSAGPLSAPTVPSRPSVPPPTEPAPQQPTLQQPIPPPVTPQSATITFISSGYSPATLTVKKGTIVTFKNGSAGQVWPASAMHPTHAVYPTTGGCIGSTFDACRGIEPGGSWSFTFGVVGSWKYHDHLNPSFTGAIVVE